MNYKTIIHLVYAFIPGLLLAAPLIDYVQTDAQVKKDASKNRNYQRTEYLNDFTKPWLAAGDPDEKIEFLFESAELSTLVDYFAARFNIIFILDDALSPAPQGGKSILGSKISFRTYEPMSKKDAWSAFTTFLDLAGLAVIPGPSDGVYRITTTDPKSPLSPSKNPLPLYFNTAIDELPDNDSPIRYITFINSASLDSMVNIVNELKSPNSPKTIVVSDMRALIITDKASSVKNILRVIRELDQANPSEVLKILKLERIDATKAVTLYKELIKTEEPTLTARLLGQKKKSSVSFFSENVRLTAIPHLNSIVLIGNKSAVVKTMDFIRDTLDRRADVYHTPIFTYQLRHTDAEEIARILNAATKFEINSEAAKAGGVRDGDKYFKPVFVESEKMGNNLMIYADYEDYTKIYNLIKKIDIEQPQVAIKVLLLNIDLTDTKEIGTQLRNKIPGVNGLLGNNVNFQTSGFVGTDSPVIENPNLTGASRLLGDLINLATLSGNLGSTLLTLGSDAFGVWGLFKILEQHAKTSVISNPFLVTKNKYPAQIAVGTTRRVIDSNISNGTASGTNTYKDLAANLTVNITPQISQDGLINLDVLIKFEQFTSNTQNQNDPTAGNRTVKSVRTSVIVGNNEVLALGGLVRDDVEEFVTKVPILGDIPIIGNLFKNSSKIVTRTSLLVLILPEIIPSNTEDIADRITEDKVLEAKSTYFEEAPQRDPITRWFFNTDKKTTQDTAIDDFMSLQDKYIDESMYDRVTNPPKKREPFGGNSILTQVPQTNRSKRTKAPPPEQQPHAEGAPQP